MSKNLLQKRTGLSLLQLLFVVGVLAASVVSLSDQEYRERTLELTFDGLRVGAIATLIRMRSPILRRTYCKGRSLLCDGLVGGYLYGLLLALLALLACL